MRHLAEEFIAHLAVERGSSPHTIEAYRRDIGEYLGVLESRGIISADAVTRDDVGAFVSFMRDRGLAPGTVERKLSAVKSFHKFIVREGLTENHPTAHIPLPKVPKRLPDVISIDDADKLLSQPFGSEAPGLRDKAILEVLYGCGLRVSELTGLGFTDIDLDAGFMRVLGKGGKERG
ncbi:MAG: site-specific integrase, partial [Coriobacteriia bacterium]|nr:site-specific integrase [Coriobacteriia bacterium]